MSSADLRALSHTRTNTLLSLFSLSFSSLISLLSKAAQKKRGERRLARSRTHTYLQCQSVVSVLCCARTCCGGIEYARCGQDFISS